jgi:FkbM family methyltransferase
MKKQIKLLLEKCGYSLVKRHKSSLQHSNCYQAVRENAQSNSIILFDIGANRGQTIKAMYQSIPNGVIHVFEPSKSCFKYLEENYGDSNLIHLNNAAIGAEESVLNFNEYSWDAMSSLLKRAFGSAKIVNNYDVNVLTVDGYCQLNNIPHINLLKSDTEGYELHVLKGASNMIKSNKVGFVLVEIFFHENYLGQDDFGEIYTFLNKQGFRFIRFYEMDCSENGIPSRTDALFFNPEFKC